MTDWGTDLHHEKNSVENDEGHDEVLKGGGDYHLPQLVLEAVSFFWHVTFQWLRLSKNVLGKENEMGRQCVVLVKYYVESRYVVNTWMEKSMQDF